MNIEKIDLSKSPWNFKIDGANTSVFVEWKSTTDSVFIFHLQHKGGRV